MRLRLLLIAIALAVSWPALAMPEAVHLAIGAEIGERCDSPVEAFALGYLSHIALDTMIPHQYGVNWWTQGEWQKDADYLAVEVIGCGVILSDLIRDRNVTATWGAIGAVLPDVVDALLVLSGGMEWKVTMPPHNGWPGYIKATPYNKEQTIVGTILLVGVVRKF